MKQIVQRTKYYILILLIAVTGMLYFGKDDIFAKTGFGTISAGDHEENYDLSDNTASGSDVSGEITGGDVSDTDVSGNTVSGSDITDGDISGNSVTDRQKYMTVTEDYFDDALFIGDSRTVGLHDYAKLNNTTFYASTGLTVYKMFTAKIATLPGSKKKVTIEEALEQQKFNKIYIMIGINEMGTGTAETFKQKYSERIERIKELQPDAIIYIQSIMLVTTERSNKGDYINNEGIIERNNAIAELADGERIFYLDVNEAVTDETGGLVSEYTFDGVHLKAAYVDIWKNYLLEHAIQLEE